MSANAIFNAVPYGGKLILKVEPEVEKIKAKKSLKANNLVAEGDVQFGGTTATKGTLSMHNVKGRAKALEAVDAHINNLYLYGIKFPQPTAEVMQWQELTLENGYTATFLTAGFKDVAPPVKCAPSPSYPLSNLGSALSSDDTDNIDGNTTARVDLAELEKNAGQGDRYYDIYYGDYDIPGWLLPASKDWPTPSISTCGSNALNLILEINGYTYAEYGNNISSLLTNYPGSSFYPYGMEMQTECLGVQLRTMSIQIDWENGNCDIFTYQNVPLTCGSETSSAYFKETIDCH